LPGPFLAVIALFLGDSLIGGYGVRGAKAYAAITLVGDGRTSSRPGSRLIYAGIVALAIGFALGLQAARPGVSVSEAPGLSVSETVQPKDFFDPGFDPRASLGSPIPSSRGFQLASLGTETVYYPATQDTGRAGSTTSATGGSSSAEEILPPTSRVASFDERFAGVIEWPVSRPTTLTNERAGNMIPFSPDPGGHGGPRRTAVQSARASASLPPLPPASVVKKPVRVADASSSDDLGESPAPDADDHTAIYDISRHRVYLPNGQSLEAHSGLGSHLDDPRYVSERDRGPTPPNVYDLSLREESFHGVRAIRLNPVGGGTMFGRDGLLAHSYMLGPNGQSNGCVSFSDYSAFLNAYLSGEINRLVVVERLTTPPSPKTPWGGLVASIKGLFGRS
jgi:hypothetical protein